MAEEYISRDAVMRLHPENVKVIGLAAYVDVEELMGLVSEIPAADVEPVRRGLWIGKSGIQFQGECSACGYRTYDKTADWTRKYWPYCPNCGAKMDLI